eukprot:6623796-Alexandrium_andersonii.AAC.1
MSFAVELYDVFLGQFCLAQFPHRPTTVLLPARGEQVFDFTRHFLGAHRYLVSLDWHPDDRGLVVDRE